MNFCNGFDSGIFHCSFDFQNGFFVCRFVSVPCYRECHAASVFCVCNDYRWKRCLVPSQSRKNDWLYRSYDCLFYFLKYGSHKFFCCLFVFVRCSNCECYFTVPHSVKWTVHFSFSSDKAFFSGLPCKCCTIFSFLRKCQIVVYCVQITDVDGIQILLNNF